jgi:DnaA family protein
VSVPPKRTGAPVGPLPFGTAGADEGRRDGGAVDPLDARHPQRVLDLVPRPARTFANFIAGDNAELVASLRAPAGEGAAGRFFYLWGPPGSGRTHLLHAAVADAPQALPPGPAARYMDLREPDAPLGIELLAGPGGRPVSRLALDNVEALDAGGQQRLFNLYNTVRQEHPGCSLLVAGDRPPSALALRADLVTRLSWGLTYQVHPLTDAQKAAAMAAHARARGSAIAPEVLDWLLQTMPRDLPTLLAVVDSLDRYSLAAKRPVTLPLAREWLRSLG